MTCYTFYWGVCFFRIVMPCHSKRFEFKIATNDKKHICEHNRLDFYIWFYSEFAKLAEG